MSTAITALKTSFMERPLRSSSEQWRRTARCSSSTPWLQVSGLCALVGRRGALAETSRRMLSSASLDLSSRRPSGAPPMAPSSGTGRRIPRTRSGTSRWLTTSASSHAPPWHSPPGIDKAKILLRSCCILPLLTRSSTMVTQSIFVSSMECMSTCREDLWIADGLTRAAGRPSHSVHLPSPLRRAAPLKGDPFVIATFSASVLRAAISWLCLQEAGHLNLRVWLQRAAKPARRQSSRSFCSTLPFSNIVVWYISSAG
mmetsp:Transcript_40240/g.93190  ORF Transcript_40240/g.93190 Transcript_40240/m.93190 type:complete len:257 (-) Transcript_40240:370-1140(-)